MKDKRFLLPSSRLSQPHAQPYILLINESGSLKDAPSTPSAVHTVDRNNSTQPGPRLMHVLMMIKSEVIGALWHIRGH